MHRFCVGGTAGDMFQVIETLRGGNCKDSLTGDHGTDTVGFSYDRDEHVIPMVNSRAVSVVHADGTDLLDYVEILRCADGDVIL